MSKAALLLLFVLAIPLVGAVVARDGLRRHIRITVWRLHAVSWRWSMLVLNCLDWLLLGTLLFVFFDLAHSLGATDLRFLLELVSIIIIIGIIVADLRQDRVARADASIEFGLVLALANLGVALDLGLPVLIGVCLSLANLLLSLGGCHLLLNRH